MLGKKLAANCKGKTAELHRAGNSAIAAVHCCKRQRTSKVKQDEFDNLGAGSPKVLVASMSDVRDHLDRAALTSGQNLKHFI